MEFRFKSDITPLDLWKLSMYHTYHSMIGGCNIVFTGAMFVASYFLLNNTNDIIEVLLIVGCLLFTVIQPALVYLRARSQVAGVPKDMELLFNESGLHVTVGEQHESIPWKKIKGVTKEHNMVIIHSDERHGYILTNRAMGEKRESFLELVEQKIK